MTRTTARRAPRRTSTVVVAIACTLVGLTLAGCFPTGPDPQPTATGLATPLATAPQAPLVVPAVLDDCPLETAVHFRGYWLPTDQVYICRADGRHDTDGVSSYGPWESASRIARPRALLAAYLVPDAVASASPCFPHDVDPLIVWVRRDGVTTAYYAPVDGCGLPSRAARDAYTAARRTLLIDVDRGAPDRQITDSPTPGSAKDVTG